MRDILPIAGPETTMTCRTNVQAPRRDLPIRWCGMCRSISDSRFQTCLTISLRDFPMARVLLVDDSRMVRQVCCRILTEMGFETIEAENGEMALQTLMENPDVELMLLDVNMPVMDGISCLKTLRSMPSLPQPRVVMCTTENELAIVSDALGSGADEYIFKPFTEEIIREKVLEAFVA